MRTKETRICSLRLKYITRYGHAQTLHLCQSGSRLEYLYSNVFDRDGVSVCGLTP